MTERDFSRHGYGLEQSRGAGPSMTALLLMLGSTLLLSKTCGEDFAAVEANKNLTTEMEAARTKETGAILEKESKIIKTEGRLLWMDDQGIDTFVAARPSSEGNVDEGYNHNYYLGLEIPGVLEQVVAHLSLSPKEVKKLKGKVVSLSSRIALEKGDETRSDDVEISYREIDLRDHQQLCEKDDCVRKLVIKVEAN